MRRGRKSRDIGVERDRCIMFGDGYLVLLARIVFRRKLGVRERTTRIYRWGEGRMRKMERRTFSVESSILRSKQRT